VGLCQIFGRTAPIGALRSDGKAPQARSAKRAGAVPECMASSAAHFVLLPVSARLVRY